MGIPVVVCLALAFSLIESLLILPSHLAHMKPEPEIAQTSWLGRTRRACADGLSWFANDRYKPFLEKCLRNHAMVGGFPRNAVLQFGLIWRWLFEKRFLSSGKFRFRGG